MGGTFLSRDTRGANWNGSPNSLPLLSDISARHHCGSVRSRTRIAHRCCGDGIRMHRFHLAPVRETAWRSQSRHYLHLPDPNRHVRTDMGGSQVNATNVRSVRPLHRLLFRYYTLAVCLSSMESREPHWTVRCGDLDLGYRLPREGKTVGSNHA